MEFDELVHLEHAVGVAVVDLVQSLHKILNVAVDGGEEDGADEEDANREDALTRRLCSAASQGHVDAQLGCTHGLGGCTTGMHEATGGVHEAP